MSANTFKQKARRFYEKINLGEFDEEYFGLFAEDIELFYPKYGFAYGKEAIVDFGAKVQGTVKSLAFDLDKFVYTCEGSRVAVEIVEYGITQSGKLFPDGKTSFGKFCNVFEFDGTGKIKRYHCYGDPDFAGEDAPRVLAFSRVD
ncbi:nuclear transport factor 2 family protein [Neisseria animaloris]|uniref:SnoaL-like domain-containing protein n=1 Tax=Neisseria animaloris TaxID=326522 RepID=A0A3S4ZDK4_9NEIS|nr:nuclear transport factor 2 family protein [Neisseria animaloris]VEJ22129.1 Uncharacterised protein [Neisseria animaloris]